MSDLIAFLIIKKKKRKKKKKFPQPFHDYACISAKLKVRATPCSVLALSCSIDTMCWS